MTSPKKKTRVFESAEDNQRSDQVEPMHRGAKAETDEYGSRREHDSGRGAPGVEPAMPGEPGGISGEHSGQQTSAGPVEPGHPDDDDDEAPETPTDEPMPQPIVDPPPDDRPRPPMVARDLSSPGSRAAP
jgi:hypothetical protein